jgi:hypothetical protein
MVRRFLLNLFRILFICSGLVGQVNVSSGEGEYAEEVYVDPAQIGWVQSVREFRSISVCMPSRKLKS